MADVPETPNPSARNEPQPAPIDGRVLRLIDASLNRATEGARVVEDYTRFVLDDRLLTEAAKRLRHGLAEASAVFGYEDRLAARDTQGDVGTTFTLASEATRATLGDVCVASLERLQQALRSLEEYSKAVSPGTAGRFESLRYSAYSLAKSIAAGRRGLARLGRARLYVLVEGGESEEDFVGRIRELCVAGVDVLQLRDKRLGDRELLGRARRLVEATADTETLAIINDRPDIARLSGADGVHVGQDELSVSDARAIAGPQTLIGVSTHSPAQLKQAVADGANYVGLGPTFPSTTKRFDSFPGTEYLRHAAGATSLPAFAIGGVTPENLDEVLGAGIRRIAVASAVTEADDPAAAAKRLLERLEAAQSDDAKADATEA
ncbi:MAG: thiamine phosphate synthase [Planctomycetota bacterium]